MKSLTIEKITPFALVLLITGAIDSIRNLPTTALFGSSIIFFFIFSAIVFLIPIALISAELASEYPDEEGGIYSWVNHAFGKKTAFFTIWLQWINTMVWYPTILSFIAGTLAHLIHPALAQNRYYIITVILTIFWSLTGLGMRGLRASARFASICALLGMLFPMAVIIILAFVWILSGYPLAIDLSWHAFMPNWKDSQSWVSLTAIMTAFLGMELAAVHVRNIDNPQRHFPRAILASACLILITMIFGSLAIAFVLKPADIDLVDGVMQAFTNFLSAFHLSFLTPVLGLLLLLGSLGGMINWIISPAKGLLLAANHGFLPKWLYQLNHRGVPSHLLLFQAIIVTLLCGLFLIFPSINAIYWLFTDLSTELYVMMYILLFLAAWRLKMRGFKKVAAFTIPGGRFCFFGTCIAGIFGCLVTLIVGFIPPEGHVDFGGKHHFQLIFVAGIIIMIAPAWFLSLKNRHKVL